MHAVPVSHAGTSAANASSATQSASQSEDSFDFWDFLDIINPLQHIPIVNVLYREITGDEIGSAAKLIGGGLYGLGLLGGGWISMASSALDFAVEGATGEDIAGHVMDFVFGEDGEAAGDGSAVADGAANGGLSEEDAAVLAAVPRPPTVVVRSEGPSDAPRESLFGAPEDTDGESESVIGSEELAAATGQVVSTDMNQALLLAAQGDEAAAAQVFEQLAAQDRRPGRRMIAPGVMGFSLDNAEVQVETGVTQNRLTGQLDVAVN